MYKWVYPLNSDKRLFLMETWFTKWTQLFSHCCTEQCLFLPTILTVDLLIIPNFLWGHWHRSRKAICLWSYGLFCRTMSNMLTVLPGCRLSKNHCTLLLILPSKFNSVVRFAHFGEMTQKIHKLCVLPLSVPMCHNSPITAPYLFSLKKTSTDTMK